LDDLLAEVEKAREAKTVLDGHTSRIRELLIEVRWENPTLKLAELEEKIGKFYDRATISRITIPALRERSGS
jgi:hypothetical protein